MSGVPDDPLRLDFCGMEFATPLILLSGCVGFGEEYTRVEGFSNHDVGAVVLKGTTGECRLEAGTTARLVLAWEGDRPVRLLLPGAVVEVR